MLLQEIRIHTPLKLIPKDKEFFALGEKFHVDFICDEGCVCMKLDPPWFTDLRSGTDLINPIVPKWGNEKYTACILGHDCAFSGWLSFHLANDLFLRQGLVLSDEIGGCTASLAYNMVELLGRSHYHDLEEELPDPYKEIRQYEHMKIVAKPCYISL